MEDLEADPGNPGEEEQRHEVRVDQDVQELVQEGRVHLVHLGSGEVEREPLRHGLPPVELAQERRQARGDDVDHVHLQRLARGEVRRLPYRQRRPGRVASVTLGQRGERGDRVVDHLAAQVLPDVLARAGDWRRGTDVRLGSHGQYVRGLTDPDAGRGSARTVGIDVDDDRDRRRELGLVDLPHRLEQAAGRVQEDHYGAVVLARRAPQLVRDIALRNRVDLEIEVDGEDARSCCRGR